MRASKSEYSSGAPAAAMPPGGDSSARGILVGLLLGGGLGLVANVLLRPGAAVESFVAWDLNGDGVHDGLDWFCQNVTTVIGRLFLRLMTTVVVPLMVSALALPVVEIGDL